MWSQQGPLRLKDHLLLPEALGVQGPCTLPPGALEYRKTVCGTLQVRLGSKLSSTIRRSPWDLGGTVEHFAQLQA